MDFHLFLNCLWKRVIALLTTWYIRTTFPAGVHFRRKHFSYLKEIYGLWKMSCFCCTNMCIDFHLFLNGLWKRAIAISTARYIRTTFPAGVHFRRKHFSYLKENLLDRPYGPQGPWAQPLFDCVAVPSGGFFSAKKASQQKMRISKKIGVFLRIVAILANVDLNLRFKMCTTAI